MFGQKSQTLLPIFSYLQARKTKARTDTLLQSLTARKAKYYRLKMEIKYEREGEEHGDKVVGKREGVKDDERSAR